MKTEHQATEEQLKLLQAVVDLNRKSGALSPTHFEAMKRAILSLHAKVAAAHLEIRS